MRIIHTEGRVVWSASDLKAAAECEFAWCRAIDAKLGRVDPVDDPEDPMLARAARLGDVHEERVLTAYKAELGDQAVRVIERTSSADDEALQAAVDETLAALRSDAQLVFQAAFATAEFVGFADFLRRDADGRWRVQDSKLARSARTTALMQLAAYVDQLDLLGIPRSDEVDLLLGDGTTSTHAVDDVLPLFHVRRARLRALIADRRVADGAEGEPLAWGDDRGDLEVRACGRCATCEEQVIAARDLLMVARMRPVQRTRLRDAGVETIDQLAAASDAPAGMNPETFANLRAQARLQIAASETPEGAPPPVEVHQPQAIHTLPKPNAGDIFFDFEGDPLYTEDAVGDGERAWGLDYLFGWVNDREEYTAIWAHSFAEERRALLDFLAFVSDRRRTYPGMHIYHYAPYETSHLSAMAARHGVGEEEVDALLREGVFVDLYPIVLRSVRIGERSYSIKKLEPLYMGDEVRTSDVQKGDVSIERYVAARSLRESGQDAEAQPILDDLADYNRYDCVSTRRLRNWLIALAREAGVNPAPPEESDAQPYEPPPLAGELYAAAERAEAEGRDGGLYRFAAAAISYYPREAKTYWQGHFLRLREPVSMWANAKDVVHIDPALTTARRDWSVDEGRER
ncbi:TM0106 family RecB-like putative nuclease [Microbacterium sp. NIBRBAC000506063]|uniref:TM0106 family RecB-like putative nuclease n=1 Tax=Microbacterium sp. NIBRBAC000506063 TaxID=2734618 RepID=UPI00397F98EF